MAYVVSECSRRWSQARMWMQPSPRLAVLVNIGLPHATDISLGFTVFIKIKSCEQLFRYNLIHLTTLRNCIAILNDDVWVTLRIVKISARTDSAAIAVVYI